MRPAVGESGRVDRYEFTAGSVTTTLPCVVLAVDGAVANPCLDAGGTFVRNVATLARTVAEPRPEFRRLATVTVCTAVLTVTVHDVGINSAPGYAIC